MIEHVEFEREFISALDEARRDERLEKLRTVIDELNDCPEVHNHSTKISIG